MSQVLWTSIGSLIVGGLIGAFLGFYFTRRSFEKQMKENPPVSEKMIRAMFLQMGRKPSEAQINAVLKSMGQDPRAKDKDKTANKKK